MTTQYTSLDKSAVLYATLDNGDVQAIKTDNSGALGTAITGPLWPFGSLKSESATVLFQADGVFGINAGQNITNVSGSGSATNPTSLIKVSTGATINSFAQVESRKRLRYRPGQGSVIRFTGIWSAPAANSEALIGVCNAENCLMVGYEGTSFGISYRRYGVREIQTMTVTTKSTTTENITVTLNGVAHTVAVTDATASTTLKTAYEISRGTYGDWNAEAIGSTVVFVSKTVGDKAGTFSITATTAQVSFAETLKGVATTDTFIPQTAFNGDKLNGTGDTGFVIDTTKLNIFQFGIQYLGAGVFTLDVGTYNSRGVFSWTRAHTIKNPNTLTTPNFSNPTFPMTLRAKSLGSTTDVSVATASYCGMIEGQKFLEGGRFSYSNVSTAVGSAAGVYYELFSVKNNLTYAGRPNQTVVNLLSVACSCKHANATVTVFLIRNATLAVAPNYVNYSTTSATSLDTTATTVTFTDNSQIIWSGQMAESGNLAFSFSDDITLQPGETITVCARASTGTASFVNASINTREDQ